MKPPPRLACICGGCATTTIGGVCGIGCADGAIDIGCAQAALLAKNRTAIVGKSNAAWTNSGSLFVRRDAVQRESNNVL